MTSENKVLASVVEPTLTKLTSMIVQLSLKVSEEQRVVSLQFHETREEAKTFSVVLQEEKLLLEELQERLETTLWMMVWQLL